MVSCFAISLTREKNLNEPDIKNWHGTEPQSANVMMEIVMQNLKHIFQDRFIFIFSILTMVESKSVNVL